MSYIDANYCPSIVYIFMQNNFCGDNYSTIAPIERIFSVEYLVKHNYWLERLHVNIAV